jgi:hypothetical protein
VISWPINWVAWLVAAALLPHGVEAQTIPSLVERIANDNVTVRAVRLDTPLEVDGRLDEEVYTQMFGFPDVLNRTFAVNITRLVRF